MPTGTPPRTAFTASRLIAGSLAGGVTAFAAVSWVVARDRPMAGEPAGASIFVYAWIAVTFGSLLAALAIWRTMVAPRIRRGPESEADAGVRAGALQAGLVIVWALLETPALLGVAIHLLYGTTLTLSGGLVTIWLGIALTWPRREWFLPS